MPQQTNALDAFELARGGAPSAKNAETNAGGGEELDTIIARIGNDNSTLRGGGKRRTISRQKQCRQKQIIVLINGTSSVCILFLAPFFKFSIFI